MSELTTPPTEPKTAPETGPKATAEQWTADALPPVAPNAKFRQDLQRALEQTHRQQMAQRKLGTQPPAAQPGLLRDSRLRLALLALLAVVLVWFVLRPKSLAGSSATSSSRPDE